MRVAPHLEEVCGRLVLFARVAALALQRSVLQMAPQYAYVCRTFLLDSRSADVLTPSYICDAGPAARYCRRHVAL